MKVARQIVDIGRAWRRVRDRFWAKVTKGPGCWAWRGCKSEWGYGFFGAEGRNLYAHRAAWMICYGDIPDGLVIRHSCDSKSCVRPHHLLLGTNLDNMRDARERGRMRGSLNGGAILTEEIVRLCRSQWDGTCAHIRVLAERYGVQAKTMRGVVSGYSWKHVV